MSDNKLQYNKPDVVKCYAEADGLQPDEAYAFDKYIRSGETILDLGVGGGRTTPYLVAKAKKYVGVDYSDAMVEACQRKFPDLEFHCEDASDLSRFADASFDVVVFSLNGIDYIRTDEARARCLLEVKRVLKPGGRFLFSSHNAKSIATWPVLTGANPVQFVWRIVRAAVVTVPLAWRQLRAEAFRTGIGYLRDPQFGGFDILVSTPDAIAKETREARLTLLETVGGRYPSNPPRYFTPWYFYVLTREA